MSTPTSLDGRPGVRSPSRYLLPLGPAVVVVVVLEAALGPVGLGAAGRPLLLTVSTAVYAVTSAVRALGGRVTAGTDGGSGFRVHVAVP